MLLLQDQKKFLHSISLGRMAKRDFNDDYYITFKKKEFCK